MPILPQPQGDHSVTRPPQRRLPEYRPPAFLPVSKGVAPKDVPIGLPSHGQLHSPPGATSHQDVTTNLGGGVLILINLGVVPDQREFVLVPPEGGSCLHVQAFAGLCGPTQRRGITAGSLEGRIGSVEVLSPKIPSGHAEIPRQASEAEGMGHSEVKEARLKIRPSTVAVGTVELSTELK